jgi:ABC-type polysaccharide transport system permease subunit
MFWRQRDLHLLILPLALVVLVFSYLPIYGIIIAFKKSFGPVVLFRTMFEKAWSDALGAIAARRDAGREIIEL